MTISLNPTESFIDTSINGQNINTLCLSFQLSLNEVSFCITDNSHGNYLAIVSYSIMENTSILELSDFLICLFEQQQLLKKDFTQLIFSFKNNTSTLIPSLIFDPNQKASYLNFLKEDLNDQIIKYDYIKEIDTYNLYSIPNCIERVILSKFLKAKIIHHSTNLIINSLNHNSLNKNTENLFVNINSKQFELIIIREGKLQFYNSFHFKMKEDFLFYLLFSMKQHNCIPNRTEIILMGKIAEKSSIHELLLKYIMSVSFVKSSSATKLNPVFGDLPEHYYFTLLNLYKCVL